MAPFNVTNLFSNEKLCIFYTETFDDEEFLLSLNSNTYVFLQFTWNIEEILNEFPWEIHKKKTGEGFNFKKNLIFCAPNELCYLTILSKGFSAVLLNHNALLDYELFQFQSNLNRNYTAVINSRPFWWKRVYLCKGINGIAYIKGSDWAKDNTSWTEWKEINFEYLAENIPPHEVREIYKKSNMGLILSGYTGENTQKLAEGANYSTGEYLLSGLPVISTPSKGGREFWLNTKNCIIIEPSTLSLEKSINLCKKYLAVGFFVREKIREDFIKKANYCRHLFCNKLDSLLKDKEISRSGENLFKDIYFHKLISYNVDRELLIKKAKIAGSF